MNFDILPVDIIFEITLKLPYLSIIHLVLTNKRLFNLFQRDSKFIETYTHQPISSWLTRFSLPQAFTASAREGDFIAVDAFLRNGINPAIQKNWALIWAARNGHCSIVRRLLRDDRVNPTDQNFEAVKLAIENNQPSTLQLLIRDPKVNFKSNGHRLFDYAKRVNHSSILKLLLAETIEYITQSPVLVSNARYRSQSIKIVYNTETSHVSFIFPNRIWPDPSSPSSSSLLVNSPDNILYNYLRSTST